MRGMAGTHRDTGRTRQDRCGISGRFCPVDEGIRQAGKCLSFDGLTWKLGVMGHHVVWVCEMQDG